jgi:hypothetical protein
MPIVVIDDNQIRTVIVPPVNDGSDAIIPLIILMVAVIFFGYIIYLLISSNFETSSASAGATVNSDIRSVAYITCPPGQCGTDILSGQKICPEFDVEIAIDPRTQVCNSRYVCDNLLTPYAVGSDSATNINGVCPPGVECPCINHFQCADYITAAFTSNGGNPYVTTNGQRITFPQITEVPPITFINPSLTFCTAPAAWLPFSSPGCNFVNGPGDMDYDNIVLCMGLLEGYEGLSGSACKHGILAVITGEPDALTRTNITQAQFGCVRGESCPGGQLNVYDTNYNGVICRVLP